MRRLIFWPCWRCRSCFRTVIRCHRSVWLRPVWFWTVGSRRSRPCLHPWPVWLWPIRRRGSRSCLYRGSIGFGTVGRHSSRSCFCRRSVCLGPIRPGPYHWPHHRRRTDALVCHQRSSCYSFRGASMIDGGELGPVGRGSACQFHLCPHRWGVRRTVGGNFCARRTGLNAMRATVVADAVVDDGAVNHHGAVVDIGDVDAAEVVDLAVIGKVISMPISALIANSCISESVVDPAIKADVTAPIAVVEAVTSTDEAPVGRRPQRALIRRCDPGAWNPVIAASTPAPVARSPKIARLGNGRLLILRQRRRRLLRVIGGGGIVVGVAVVLIGVVLVTLYLVALIIRRLRRCLRRGSGLRCGRRCLTRRLRCRGGVRGYRDWCEICVRRIALILRIVVRRRLGLV